MLQSSSLATCLNQLLICAVFIISPFYFQQGPGGEALSIPYNNIVWISALIAISYSVFQILHTRQLRLPKYWLGMAALPCGLLISGLILEVKQTDVWMMRIGFILAGFMFFIALFQAQLKRRQYEQVLFALCLAASCHAIIAYTQLKGWYWTDLIPNTEGNQPISVFQQVNVLATYMSTAFFCALYLLTSPSQKFRHWALTLILLFTLFTTISMLLAISSRTTLVAFAVSLPIILLCSGATFKRKKLLAFFIVLAICSGLISGSNLSNGFARYESKISKQTGHARTFIYDLSWQIFKEKPLLGHGLGSFDQVFQQAKSNYPEKEKLGPQHYSHPHNELLFWMIESGGVSLVGIFIALYVTVSALVKLGWRRGGRYLALLFPISIHTQVELPFYHSAALWFLWLFLLFKIHNHQVLEKKIQLSKALTRLIAVVTIASTSLLSIFFLHTLVSLSGLTLFFKDRGANITYLSPAIENIYFRDLAELLAMRTVLYRGVANKNSNSAIQYINWANSYLQRKPNVDVMSDLILAQSYLGRTKQADLTAQTALNLYPKNALIIKRLTQLQARKGPLKTLSNDAGATHN